MRGIVTSDQTAPAPPNGVMNSRSRICSPQTEGHTLLHCPTGTALCVTANFDRRWPVWVNSRHPRAGHSTSAKCQNRPWADAAI